MEEQEEVLPEGEVLPPEVLPPEVEGMTTTAIGRKRTITPGIDTQSRTQTGVSVMMYRDLQEQEGAQDLLVIPEEIMSKGQATIQEGMPLEKTEPEGIIGTEKTTIDRMVMGRIEARVGIEVEDMVLIELANMAMGGNHEDSARRFQTWGNLRWAPP